MNRDCRHCDTHYEFKASQVKRKIIAKKGEVHSIDFNHCVVGFYKSFELAREITTTGWYTKNHRACYTSCPACLTEERLSIDQGTGCEIDHIYKYKLINTKGKNLDISEKEYNKIKDYNHKQISVYYKEKCK